MAAFLFFSKGSNEIEETEEIAGIEEILNLEDIQESEHKETQIRPTIKKAIPVIKLEKPSSNYKFIESKISLHQDVAPTPTKKVLHNKKKNNRPAFQDAINSRSRTIRVSNPANDFKSIKEEDE